MNSTTILDTLIVLVLYLTYTEAYSTNTIGNILKRLSDCQFNSIKVQTGDIKSSNEKWTVFGFEYSKYNLTDIT